MEIWIIYVIKQLLLPPAILLILAAIGIACAKPTSSWGLTMVKLVLLVFYLLSTPVIATRLAVSQEHYPALTAIKALDSEAIVVLGGGLRSPAPEYSEQATSSHFSLERLRYAAFIERQTKLPVLVSGGNVFANEYPPEAEVMASILINEFHTAVRWQETESRNTAENARFCHSMLAAEHINRIILVTHALHMPRATEQFRRVGFKVHSAPTAITLAVTPLKLLNLLPSADALALSSMALHELLGRMWYRLRYQELS